MTTFNATPATLAAVLASASGGDTLRLAPGDYVKARLSRPAFDKPVTIEAADPASPPRFTGGLTIDFLGNVRFVGVDVALADASAEWAQAVRVYGGAGLDFVGGRVSGRVAADGTRSGYGLVIDKVSGLLIHKMAFADLSRGVLVSNSDKIGVSWNHFDHLGSDGVDFAACNDVLVADNSFGQIHPRPADHPDAIQFWTEGTTRPSERIVIARNIVRRGAGPGYQGIFLKDEVGTLPYRHVQIVDNLLVGTGYHGIHCNHGEDVEVSGNELLSVDADTGRNWILLQGITGEKVVGNGAILISVNGKAMARGEGGNVLNLPTTDSGKAAIDAWMARFRPTPVVEAPAPDTLRAAMAVHTDAKVEPLKRSGRLTVNFKNPAEATTALAALRAVRQV